MERDGKICRDPQLSFTPPDSLKMLSLLVFCNPPPVPKESSSDLRSSRSLQQMSCLSACERLFPAQTHRRLFACLLAVPLAEEWDAMGRWEEEASAGTRRGVTSPSLPASASAEVLPLCLGPHSARTRISTGPIFLSGFVPHSQERESLTLTHCL